MIASRTRFISFAIVTYRTDKELREWLIDTLPLFEKEKKSLDIDDYDGVPLEEL